MELSKTRFKLLWMLIGIMMCGLLTPSVSAEGPLYPSPASRFGVGLDAKLADITAYDVASLHVGWYGDWKTRLQAPRPDGVEYSQLIWVGKGSIYPSLAELGSQVSANPGALWLVGNEPECLAQGNNTPAQYAEAYHQAYTLIKQRDPTARVAIGAVAQPTPLRLEWLNQVLSLYQEAHGTPMPVDVWNVHVYIVRELDGSWGSGIPRGLEATEGRLYGIEDSDNIGIFRQLIVDFRTWMREHGQQNKPLIITELGVLFPATYGFTTERVNAFMTATFDYLLSAVDANLGYPADENRLVQRWSWFSLNAKPYDAQTSSGFNGELFDYRQSQYPGALTAYGINYKEYTDKLVYPPQRLARRTRLLTMAFGAVTVDGAPAPTGTVVEARSPRGDVVGYCEVPSAGRYGTMLIYGEDVTAVPAVGGMRRGEVVSFSVNGIGATASTQLVWQDDKLPHSITLSASLQAPPTATPVPTVEPTPAPVFAEGAVTLQQGAGGYAGSADTFMYQYAAANNYSTVDSMKVGSKQQYAGLVRFDVSRIPAGSAIQQATLQLYVNGWSGGNITFGAFAIVRSTEMAEATWSRARTTENWGAPGANDTATDRRGVADGSVTTSGMGKWYSLDVTAAAQGWVNDSSTNNGVLLRQTVSSAYAVNLASAEYGTASLRPRLVVTYQAGGVAPAEIATETPAPTQTPIPMVTATATATRTATPTNAALPTATSMATPTNPAAPTAIPAVITGSQPVTVTLQQGAAGYAGSADTCVYQYAAASNYSSASALKVGSKQQNAGLVRFDVSAIPAGSVVWRAELQVYVNGWSGANITFAAYVINRTTQMREVTWNRARTGENWGAPGANDTQTDRRGIAESSVTTSGISRWYILDLTHAVQGWVNGSQANNGVLLRQSVSSVSAVNLASAECGTVGLRPRLVITYSNAEGVAP